MFKIISIFVLSVFIGCGSPSTFKPNLGVNGEQNKALIATSRTITVKKNTPQVIKPLVDDKGNGALLVNVINPPSHGSYINFIYTPKKDYIGSDSFSFTITDGMLSSNEAVITITITDAGTTPKPSTCKPLPKTGQTITYHNNDDGDLKKGATRSYTRDDANGIVTDNVTGLMWQDNESVKKPWLIGANDDAKKYNDTSGDTAITYCENLVLGSYGDWRLPTVEELYYLSDKEKQNSSIDTVFQNIASSSYWSSTTFPESNMARVLIFDNGTSGFSGKVINNYVRCIRAGLVE